MDIISNLVSLQVTYETLCFLPTGNLLRMNADKCDLTTAEGNGMGECVLLCLCECVCWQKTPLCTSNDCRVWKTVGEHIEQIVLVVVDSGKDVVYVPATERWFSLAWGCVVFSRESRWSGGRRADIHKKWNSNAETFCRRLQGCCRCEAAGGRRRGRGEEG